MSNFSSSKYSGDMKDGWYHGFGTFTYPNGVEYEGQFFKGKFHGEGTLKYNNGGYYKGIWKEGKMINGDYYFFDDLKFEEGKWDYCTGQDRSFNFERKNGIKPSGQTQLINDPAGEKQIPAGTYDTGEGFFDPIRSLIYNYEGTTLLRTPNAEEVDWIVRNCRYEPREAKEILTGESDEIVMRVMQLQDQGRRDQAEELMKLGMEDPLKHKIKEIVQATAEGEAKAELKEEKTVNDGVNESENAKTLEKEGESNHQEKETLNSASNTHHPKEVKPNNETQPKASAKEELTTLEPKIKHEVVHSDSDTPESDDN